MKILVILLIILLQSTLSYALNTGSSQEEQKLFLTDHKSSYLAFNESNPNAIKRPLFKEVVGFYTANTPEDEYKQSPIELLSIIAWGFVRPRSDGTVEVPHTWPPTRLISYAHENKVKIIIVIGSEDKTIIDSILASPAKQLILADNLLSIVESADMDGVDIDFEGINKINSISGASNRPLIVDFIKVLSKKFWTDNPSYHINMDLPARDENEIWDSAALQENLTTILIMGYDIHTQGSLEAGPNAPLDGDNVKEITIRSSINAYLADGVKKEKLLLGVPYYGFIWPTIGDARKSATTDRGKVFSYDDMVNKSEMYGRRWDKTWKTPWFAYKIGNQWYQGHYDDNESLGLKYDLVLAKDLAGIGIWRLGYDSGRNELWQEIAKKFADQAAPHISITAPSNGSELSGEVIVDINATDDLGLSETILYLDGLEVANWTALPFRFLWNTTTMKNGIHKLKAYAVDNAGNFAEKSIIVYTRRPVISPAVTGSSEVTVMGSPEGRSYTTQDGNQLIRYILLLLVIIIIGVAVIWNYLTYE